MLSLHIKWGFAVEWIPTYEQERNTFFIRTCLLSALCCRRWYTGCCDCFLPGCHKSLLLKHLLQTRPLTTTPFSLWKTMSKGCVCVPLPLLSPLLFSDSTFGISLQFECELTKICGITGSHYVQRLECQCPKSKRELLVVPQTGWVRFIMTAAMVLSGFLLAVDTWWWEPVLECVSIVFWLSA